VKKTFESARTRANDVGASVRDKSVFNLSLEKEEKTKKSSLVNFGV